MKSFLISVGEEVLFDLHTRLKQTRWPDHITNHVAWEQGTDINYLRDLTSYWLNNFDWRACEKELNTYHHFQIDIDGVLIHFIHAKSHDGKGIPLILTHGWPSTFIEMLPLVPFLTNPSSHGIDSPSFDLVIPSLPGYAFSQRPAKTGVNYRYVAKLWNQLMQKLGYKKYGAGGTDFGSGVSTVMALDYPENLIGIYLSTLDIRPLYEENNLSEKEKIYLQKTKHWDSVERGYSSIQSTKPQTLGYALNDSPTGLAAWIIEKWRSWADTKGDIESRFSRDFLLTNIMIYWVTQTITSSMRDYYDNRWTGVTLQPQDKVTIPTAIGLFNHEFVEEGSPPREWAERLYNVQRFTPMPRGGHFAAAEEPLLYAQDIAEFFKGLSIKFK